MSDDNLKRCQQASMAVEEAMIQRLLGYTPTHDLRITDILYIAREARAIAFEMFYVKAEKWGLDE